MSNYLLAPAPRTKTSPRRLAAAILSVVLASLVLLSTLAIGGFTMAQAEPDDLGKDKPFILTKWIMCRWANDSGIPGAIYQTSQSDDLQFLLFSKSSVSSGAQGVESGPWG